MEDQRFNRIFNDIIKEVQRQDNKWGQDRNQTPSTWLSILVEEVGEVAKELNDTNPTEIIAPNYRKELIEVATVAVQAILNYDKATQKGEIPHFDLQRLVGNMPPKTMNQIRVEMGFPAIEGIESFDRPEEFNKLNEEMKMKIVAFSQQYSHLNLTLDEIKAQISDDGKA